MDITFIVPMSASDMTLAFDKAVSSALPVAIVGLAAKRLSQEVLEFT